MAERSAVSGPSTNATAASSSSSQPATTSSAPPTSTAKPSLRQQFFRSFRPSQAAAPLATSTTASPASIPIDHHKFDYASPLSSEPLVNPFDAAPSGSGELAPAIPELATPQTPAEVFRSHLVELIKPLPLSEPRRAETIRDRCERLAAIGTATEQANPPPPQGQVIRVAVALLGGEDHAQYPLLIKEAACDVLAKAVKRSDERAGEAPLALRETRSGAPGSQSSKSLDSDQPLATIDRALMYRLVIDLSNERGYASMNKLPTRDDLSATSFPCLHAQLRALHALSRDGREAVCFEGIIPLLSRWLTVIWREVQALRQLERLVHFPATSSDSSAGRTDSGPSVQPIDQHLYVEQLSGREWSLQAILHLIRTIFKFNFAQVTEQVEAALQSLASLILTPLSQDLLIEDLAHSSRRSSTTTNVTGTQTIASLVAMPRDSSRSQSRDRRTRAGSMDGYSYYGLEVLSTPESGSDLSPMMTPQLGPRQGGSHVAPISLSTLAPSAGKRVPSQLSRSMTLEIEDPPTWPPLQDTEVRAIIELLDTVLKFGYVPPSCVHPVTMLLCRILGYESATMSTRKHAQSLLSSEFNPWQQAIYPVLSNLLHSHSANRAIRQVRELLMKEEAGEPNTNNPEAKEQSFTIDGVEDEAVLVGAVIFLRFTMTVLAHLAGESQSSKGPNSARSEENALAPRLPLVLLLPALRGALLRHCDVVDLHVLSLVEALLLPNGPIIEAAGPPIPLIGKHRLRMEEWNQLLELTSVAKRHIEGWQFNAAGGGSEIRVPVVLQALVTFLSKLPLANPEQLHTPQGGDSGAHMENSQSLTLPWNPKLSALLLSLAPTLPSRLTLDLIKYHRAHRLCLPVNPDWIANLQRLLQAFMYGQVRLSVDGRSFSTSRLSSPTATGSWQDKSRKALAKFLLEDVYEAVVSFPAYRANLMREIVLPTSRMLLPHETDSEVDKKTREILVQAASLSSAAPEGAEGEGEDIFTAVRELFFKLAREETASTAATGSGLGHVHFADTSGVHHHQSKRDSASIEKGDATKIEGQSPPLEGPSKSTALPKTMRSALNLISIFNQIAFSSPWFNFENAEELLATQEEKARTACIAIFRDLLSLVQPANSDATQHAVSGNNVDEASPVLTASNETRLAILQWFLRIRTDRHHRVFLMGDLDEQVEPFASIILKTPEAKAAAAAAEASALSGDRSRAARADNREGGKRSNIGGESSGLVRSRSRVKDRDASRERERGRGERVSDGVQPRGSNRSISATRAASSATPARKPASEHQSLWQLPQTLAFDMPTTSLRSDIVYTYIHDEDPSCSHHHHRGSSGVLSLPLPVSELLATYIKLMASEKDWELVSYVICHLPPQLSNKHLFCGPKAQIQVAALRQFLCSLILQQKLMEEVALPDDIKRSDVYSVCYATLTTLLSYRALFSRAQLDEMVEAFISGLNKSQNTAQPCVRALSVAIYEAQKSVTRLLPSMLVKLSTIMSHMTMSVHILELIASIGQLPACYANFTDAEYRRVFGISLQYIQYHQAHSQTNAAPAMTRNKEDFRANPASFTLSQYVMMLAYYNICLWFMTLRLPERAKYVPSIIRGLQLANEGRDQLTDQSEVCFDFLARFTHSNAEPRPKRSFLNAVVMSDRYGISGGTLAPLSSNGRGGAGSKDPGRVSKTWLVGKGLVTITAMKKEGWMEIVIRRASGTIAMVSKLENIPIDVLPEEDGEREDLPAALMMDRDPRTVARGVLKAPRAWHKGSRVRALGHEDEGSAQQEKLSPGQEAAELIREGDRLRSRKPIGPAQFGLAPRLRSASFSGPLSDETVPLKKDEDFSPYKLLPQDKVELPSIDPDEMAIEQVMQGILKEGENLQQQQQRAAGDTTQAKGSGESIVHDDKVSFNYQAPVKNSLVREPAFDPSTIALQLSSYPEMNRPPILLPDEPATTRLIKAIDLTPVVDLHKIGCLYVGPGQKDEVEILGNRHGSPAYARFLAGLGDLITLKNQEDVYTGGLDRENDLHGKYAYAWSDDISQIVFHSATMMPNRIEDPRHSSKKALIGNDWVHVVFNESGSEYVFGTIPSQFNYVNIVISPTTKGGTNLGSVGPLDTTFYRVSLQRRVGLPSFSPVGDGQLLSAGALPIFVRSLALNANVLSQIYNDTGESMQPYSSNWCNRLNHVLRYRNQWEAKRKKQKKLELDNNESYADEDALDGGANDERDFTSFV